VFVWHSNSTEKNWLRWHVLIRFIHNLVGAYFFEPLCIPVRIFAEARLVCIVLDATAPPVALKHLLLVYCIQLQHYTRWPTNRE